MNDSISHPSPTPLPAEAVRAGIAEAVHAAVTDYRASRQGSGQGLGADYSSALYAAAGAELAGLVTGGDYRPQAGALEVRVSDTPATGGTGGIFHLNPARTGYDGTEYHAWFVRHPGAGSDSEIADLGLRHYEALSRLAWLGSGTHDLTWSRVGWPHYYWGTQSGLRTLGVRLTAHWRATVVFDSPPVQDHVRDVAAIAFDYYRDRKQAQPSVVIAGIALPLAIDLGEPVSRAERHGLARHLERAAAAARDPEASVLAWLADSARGDGPLTADAEGLDAAARQRICAAIEAALLDERTRGGPDVAVLMLALGGWQDWMRRTQV